jgi:hypothetical protein
MTCVAVLNLLTCLSTQTFYAMAWAIGFYVLMSEIFPLATRSLALSLAQCLTYGMYAISSTAGLALGCRVRYALLWMFGSANVLGTVSVVQVHVERGRGGLCQAKGSGVHMPAVYWAAMDVRMRKRPGNGECAARVTGTVRTSGSGAWDMFV